MAIPLGKHAKISKNAPQTRAKHAAVSAPARNYSQMIVTVILAVLVIAVPFSFNKLLVSLNSNAMDASYTSRSLVADTKPEATSMATAQANLDETGDDLLDAAQEIADIPVVDFADRVQIKLQQSIMPAGCELISLDIVLQSMGFETDIKKIVEEHLEIDGHFGTGYSGDPYYSGGGYPQGIVNAANSYLQSMESSFVARDITGASFDLLHAYVAKGYPVLVWSTISYEDPEYTGALDSDFEWYLNEHCVVMYGFDGVQVLISDPLEGLVQLDESRFIELFDKCGSMAAVIS